MISNLRGKIRGNPLLAGMDSANCVQEFFAQEAL